MDLNNNKPCVGLLDNIMPINSLLPLRENSNLLATIKENEIGPVLFEKTNDSGTFKGAREYYVVYDPDLGENATFNLNLVQTVETNVKDLSSYLTPNFYAENEIKHKNTLNLFNSNSFDFENLNLNSTLNPLTGIASKSISFRVRLFLIVLIMT